MHSVSTILFHKLLPSPKSKELDVIQIAALVVISIPLQNLLASNYLANLILVSQESHPSHAILTSSVMDLRVSQLFSIGLKNLEEVPFSQFPIGTGECTSPQVWQGPDQAPSSLELGLL